MASFPERMGVKEPRSVLQIENLDQETRTDIWNYFFRLKEVVDGEDYKKGSDDAREIARRLWSNPFSKALDTFTYTECWSLIRSRVMDGQIVDVLWMAEEMVKVFHRVKQKKTALVLAQAFNDIFEQDLVGFRFVDLLLVPVTNSDELATIEAALVSTEDLPGAQEHLKNAVALLSNKTNPQYAKSLSESIGAVEAIVKKVADSKTLGAGLIVLKNRGYPIHPALLDGWNKIYGYTSDSGGIRHGSIDPSDVDEAMATYFLVACSAFVGLLLKIELKISAAK